MYWRSLAAEKVKGRGNSATASTGEQRSMSLFKT